MRSHHAWRVLTLQLFRLPLPQVIFREEERWRAQRDNPRMDYRSVQKARSNGPRALLLPSMRLGLPSLHPSVLLHMLPRASTAVLLQTEACFQRSL